MRISSANINNTSSSLKQIKERNERPMTSTATRFDLNGIPSISKHRSITPSGLTSKSIINNKKQLINNNNNNSRQLQQDDAIFLSNY